MSMFAAKARFWFDRVRGLFHRTLTSLRTRGWRATWQRARSRALPPPATQRPVLFMPEAPPFAPFAVPHSTAPRASIVIPVYNQCAHTLACLRALAQLPPATPCEIIVVDDGSSDQTGEWMKQIAGLRYHVREHNGGFIAACNDGAALARGEFLVFLNNDTIPQPGWLDILLETFAQAPAAGLVGAQLIYPDGRLQEAGGVVFDDGSAWNYGRFDAPDDPRYRYLRDADYCSGAAIAIPRALFEALGGFDTRYAPAYFEDTDLAFAARAAGHRVLVQPASRVVHMEGVTAGTDTGSGIKACQVRNRERFAEKWRDDLRRQPAPGALPTPALLHARQRQILVIDESTPQPDRDSGSLRLFNLIERLCALGAHVVFVPADLQHKGGYTHALQALGVEVWHAPFVSSPPAWMREHGARFDVVMMSRHFVATDFLPLVARYAPKAKAVFDTVDLHYLRETRGAELATDPQLRKAAEKTRQRELAVIARADTTLVVSEVEQQQLEQDAPSARVELLSNLHRVDGPGLAYAERSGLVFVGGFRHPPNADAVQWFVEEIFPRVRAQLPDVVFHCIGADVPDNIRRFADRPGVVVHGHVPDLAPYMDGVRIAVAPLRFGAGVKGKINLSMAHGQPVVATRSAVEGMRLRDGEDVLCADAPDAFADAVVRLYRDEALWRQLARNGLNNVARHFSLDAADAAIRRVFM